MAAFLVVLVLCEIFLEEVGGFRCSFAHHLLGEVERNRLDIERHQLDVMDRGATLGILREALLPGELHQHRVQVVYNQPYPGLGLVRRLG